jgi:hypothetical protein
MNGPITKARLDSDKTAKPMTEIRAKHDSGVCIKPGIDAKEYIFTSILTGEQTVIEGISEDDYDLLPPTVREVKRVG